MSPTKPLASAYEVELKRRQQEEAKLKLGKINKVRDGKLSKNRKMKNIMKGGGMKGPAFEAAKKGLGKKVQVRGKKNKVSGKAKAKQSRDHMEEEDDSESPIELDIESTRPGNSQEVDIPMKDESESDSIRDGEDAFSWLIAPIIPEVFFRTAWEKSPMHVKRTAFPDYYKDVLSSQKINDILRDNCVLFSKNIDVTSYRDGVRETHNPPGRATPAVVWDYYKKGCSVRMLNPQTFCPELRKLNATLQDFFGCFVGANSYLTPADSQGFAPHYDDIEAFILQIEGKKHWKVYAPRKTEEMLPRFSSENLSQDDLPKPVLEVTLHPGDLLYFPRGFIHQASTEPGHHSLHVTVSCYQKNTWGDLLEKLLPAALAVAQEEDVEFRRGLPLHYLRHLGVSNNELDTEERRDFFSHLEMLFARIIARAPVDAAVDQMAKQFMHDALPPILSAEEENHSVHSENIMTLKEDGSVSGNIQLNVKSRIKLTRSHVLRLVKEDDSQDLVQVYHCADNSLEYHGEDAQMFEVSSEFAYAMEQLIRSYPSFVAVSDLQLGSAQEKVELANLLWKKGLVLREKPVKINSN